MGFAAKIIADSIAKHTGARLTTMQVTYPRSIHAEALRHREQSRNSASSRAIPVSRMVQNALEDTYLPIFYGKNQPGMSADEELDHDTILLIQEKILALADHTADVVSEISALGLHKQTANRYLEPFIYHTEIISATTWSNFFALRISPFAQPEICKIAEMMRDVLDRSDPQETAWGEWHLPFVLANEADALGLENARKVSLARCARISYGRVATDKDLAEDLALYERLTSNGHWSPAEHVATPYNGKSGNYFGWKQLRKEFANESDFSKIAQ